MNMDDSRIIARFQSLTTGFMAAKRLGQWRPDLADELYRTWVELEQRGLKKTPEYRNVMLRADRQAWWLAGLMRLSSPDSCGALSLFKRNRVQRRAETSPTGGVVTPFSLVEISHRPQSSSASRFTAGAFGLFILSQSGDRPLQ